MFASFGARRPGKGKSKAKPKPWLKETSNLVSAATRWFRRRDAAEDEDGGRDYDQDQDDDEDDAYDEELTSASVIPSEREKTGMLSIFAEMRKESAFCDIAFTCHGTLFRAHKVVVSSWSRWLRSLLLEGSEDEVLSLDIFDPIALGSVLDYMYGAPLTVSVEVADSLLKVIRRLELQALEQQVWRFLISVMNENNCNALHDLADRYDCPPLKLAAFRMLQETDPSYAFAPINWDAARAKDNYNEGVKVRSGLTGPGELSFYTMTGPMDDYDDDDEDGGGLSIVGFAKQKRFRRPHDVDGDVDGESDEEERSNGDKDRDEAGNDDERDEHDEEHDSEVPLDQAVFPENLPAAATAREVVRAWAARLQYVYQQCLPPERGPNDDEDLEDEFTQQYAPSMVFNYTRTAAKKSFLTSKTNDEIRGRRRGGKDVDWPHELRRFYIAIKMPEKLATIDDILETWEGKEDQMLAAMLIKYKKLIPASLMEHFDNLQGALETQTESSFVHAHAAAATYRRQPSKA